MCRLASYLSWSEYWESRAFETSPPDIVEQFGLIESRYSKLLHGIPSVLKFKHTEIVRSVFGGEGVWRYNFWSALGHGSGWPSHYARTFKLGEHVYGNLKQDNEAHVQAAEFTARAIARMLEHRATYLGYSDLKYPCELRRVAEHLKPFCKPGLIEYID